MLARVVLELFLGAEVPDHGRVGARTQLTLRKPGGGAVYPDLSICAAGQALQLLVEVKLDSEFHVYPEFDGTLQPDVYRQMWGPATPMDARVRAVGTLTRDGSDVAADFERLVARDVAWRELRDAIAGQIRADRVEPAVRLVAESFVAAIDERIAPVPQSPDEEAAFFAAHRPLLDAVSRQLLRLIRGAGPSKAISGKAYRGVRIRLPDPTGQALFVRIYLAAAGSRLNLPGAPDALIAGPEHDPNGTLSAAESVTTQAAGFLNTKDLDGFWLHRRVWSLDGLAAVDAARDIAERLARSGLVAAGRVDA